MVEGSNKSGSKVVLTPQTQLVFTSSHKHLHGCTSDLLQVKLARCRGWKRGTGGTGGSGWNGVKAGQGGRHVSGLRSEPGLEPGACLTSEDTASDSTSEMEESDVREAERAS